MTRLCTLGLAILALAAPAVAASACWREELIGKLQAVTAKAEQVGRSDPARIDRLMPMMQEATSRIQDSLGGGQSKLDQICEYYDRLLVAME
jgi:hypothetical protein